MNVAANRKDIKRILAASMQIDSLVEAFRLTGNNSVADTLSKNTFHIYSSLLNLSSAVGIDLGEIEKELKE